LLLLLMLCVVLIVINFISLDLYLLSYYNAALLLYSRYGFYFFLFMLVLLSLIWLLPFLVDDVIWVCVTI
jgi:hypothetical protein